MKILVSFVLLLLTIVVNGQNFHTEFEYSGLLNKGVTIQNSYPKGGQKYTSPDGKKYTFVVFWTCITNGTDSDLEIEIDFSNDSFIIPSSPNVNFNLYLPIDAMTFDKKSLPNYGLNLKAFLDKNIDKSSKLIKTISPNDAHIFYSVVISNVGIKGPIRAGFELENKDLIYKINGYEINRGKINP